MWKKQMSEHWNQYIVQVWHDFNCIDRLHPPPPKKNLFHIGGGVKILFNRLSYSIYFKLVEASLTWYTSIYFKFFPLISVTWSVLMDLHYTGRERASSGRLCLCLQRLSRPPHCRAIIISPLSISDPMGQVAYGFPRYLILNEWLYLNGTQPNTYSVYQWQVMCMQVTNVNILCSDWELFETGRAPAVTVSSYQGSTDKADTIAQTGHLHLQSPDTTQHNTANGLTI